jgi:hypothetical protein
MVDIAGLPGALTTDDFIFKVGNNNDPTTWSSAPPLSQPITVRSGAGIDGSDRVTLIWADNAIQKQWLQVTVRATPNSGLAADDVFYFGNAIGESGNSTSEAQVNSTDVNGARMNPHFSINPAGIDDAYDYSRDRLVNSTDINLARMHTTFSVNALKLITPAAPESILALAPTTAANSQDGSTATPRQLAMAEVPWLAAQAPEQSVRGPEAEGSPELSITRSSGGNVRVHVFAPGVLCELQYSTDLAGGRWRSLGEAKSSEAEGLNWEIIIHPEEPCRYFRVVSSSALSRRE